MEVRRKSAGIGVFLLMLVVLWFFRDKIFIYLGEAFYWIDRLGPIGPLIFISIYAMLVVFLLPTALLTFSAGVLYGVFWGSVFVLASISTGSVIAFLIARYGFSDSFSHYIRNHPKLRAVDTELVHEGFKVILLTRLTPFFPGKLSNYFFGVAQFHLRDFFWATLLGTIPFTSMSVYVGSLAGDLRRIRPDMFMRSPLAMVGISAGILVAIILLSYLSRLVRHALKSSISKNSTEQDELSS